MVEFIKEKQVLKDEDCLFEMLKLSLAKTLDEDQQKKFLNSAYNNINYLKEEFTKAKGNHDNNANDTVAIDNGLLLISHLGNGYTITKDNFINENIQQFSAHYQSVKDYELAFLIYRKQRTIKNYFKTIEAYDESLSYKDGYTKEKTLTKN